MMSAFGSGRFAVPENQNMNLYKQFENRSETVPLIPSPRGRAPTEGWSGLPPLCSGFETASSHLG
jgi:hypothetical protein